MSLFKHACDGYIYVLFPHSIVELGHNLEDIMGYTYGRKYCVSGDEK
jgi:hypothetical protein